MVCAHGRRVGHDLIRSGAASSAAFPSHTKPATGCLRRVRPRLAGKHLPRDVNDLTGERTKPARVGASVGASVGAECFRLPNIDRYQATATVPDLVLRRHGAKGTDKQRNTSTMTCKQGWGRHAWETRSAASTDDRTRIKQVQSHVSGVSPSAGVRHIRRDMNDLSG